MEKMTKEQKLCFAQDVVDKLHNVDKLTYKRIQGILHIAYHIARKNKIASEQATASKKE